MRHEQDDDIARNREDVERDKSVAMSPTIHEHASGIGIECAEQSPKGIEKPDHKHARAEWLKIFRQKTHPQLLAGANEEDGDQQNNKIALESEEVGESVISLQINAPRSDR